MNSVFEMILTAICVAIVLAATYLFSNRISQKRVARDFKHPKDILTAVDVYVHYGRRSAAVKLLEDGLERYPDNAALKGRLEELSGSDADK